MVKNNACYVGGLGEHGQGEMGFTFENKWQQSK